MVREHIKLEYQARKTKPLYAATKQDTFLRRLRALFLIHWRINPLLLTLTICYLVAGFLASLLIPPWQSPDEPTHFEYARGLQIGVLEATPEIQQPIIDSFYTFHFWQYRFVETPDERPQSFADLRSGLLLNQTSKTPAYYMLAAQVSNWTDDIVLQLYSMRWLSVLLSSLTIPLVYLAAREVLPSTRMPLALLAAAMVAFLPMYSYIGASVNPDSIGAPLAAATVLCAIRAIRGKQIVLMLGMLLLLAIVTFWARRSAIAIIPWAGLIVGLFAFTWSWRHLPRIAAATVIGGAIIIPLIGVTWPGNVTAAWLPHTEVSTTTYTDRHAYDGHQSLRTINNGTAEQQINLEQALSIPRSRTLAGRTIIFEAMMRSSDEPNIGRVTIVNNKNVAETRVFDATSEWKAIELTYTVPPDTAQLFISLGAQDTGEVLFDHISLYDADTGEQQDVLSNPGGEQVVRWWEEQFASNSVVWYSSRILQAWRDGIYLSPEAFALYPHFLHQMFTSLIGRFGWMNFGLPDSLYLGAGLVYGIFACGLLGVWRRKSGLESTQRMALIALGSLVAMAIITLILEYTPALGPSTFPQGRYLFPVLSAIVVLLVSGLAQIVPKRYDRHTVIVGIMLLVATWLWSWFGIIIPNFYG